MRYLIIITIIMSGTSLGIWSIPNGGGTPTYVYDSGHNDYNAAWSPDVKRRLQ